MAFMTGYPATCGENSDSHRQNLVTFTNQRQIVPLGLIMCDGFNEYVYVQAGAAITAGQAVRVNTITSGAFSDVRPTLAASNSFAIGVATAAFNTNDQGFLLTRGVVVANVNAAVVAGSCLVSDSGTAGQLNVAVATDLPQKPATALTAAASGQATIYLV